jgi:predicted O-methyltransferase YrrM
MLGLPPREVRHFLGESYANSRFVQHIRDVTREHLAGPRTAEIHAKKVLLQYAIVRGLRPRVVVETGVANGVSSLYLLEALHRNGSGRLFSIDLGDDSVCPDGRAVGWAVPPWLTERWELRLGDARKVLAPLLAQQGPIDLFIHDSLHTAEHMLFEFTTAWPYLRPGGILVADDATWNEAFAVFTSGRAAEIILTRGIGIAQKPDDGT